MKATNVIATIAPVKTVSLIHVLANEGVYQTKNKTGRVVTVNSSQDHPVSIFVDDGRIEPLNAEFWEDEKFTVTDEKVSITIK